MAEVTPLDPANARVCVVGAGPAGLAAARALLKKGYRRITMIEANAEVGGKCHSMRVAGRSYDMGAVSVFDGYAHMRPILEEVGAKLDEYAYYNLGPGDRHETAFFPADVVEWYRAFIEKASPILDGPMRFADVVKLGFHVPIHEWMAAQGLLPIPKMSLFFYQSCGYGYVGDPIPIVYFARAVCSTSGRPFTITDGIQEVWRRLGVKLEGDGVSIRISAPVRRIEPGPTLTIVTESHERIEADAVIWTAGAGPALSALELLPEQRRALEAISYVEYGTLAVEADGLTESARRLIMLEAHQDLKTRGHVTFFLRPHADRPIYLTWQYGNGAPIEALEAQALADLTALGAESPRIRLRRYWPHYFPHFSTEAFVRGDPQALERSQGAGNIYFAGATLAMETLESAVAHAEEVVALHFSS